tara:strand:+ start:12660 stop:13979 length:1320 start_codon:yes stop_codon:yes gene_type:complete
MVDRVVILGAGISGVGAAILARKQGFIVFISDNNPIKKKHKNILEKHQVEWEEGKHTLDKMLNASEIIVSPGIPEDSGIIIDLKKYNVSIISEIEFAFRYTNARIVAITGSNGKTTTTLLLGHILKKAGFDVLIAGNVGVSFSASIALRDYQYIVLEISSFQLERIKGFRSELAIILNITPDHLDRYSNSFEKYVATKFKITKNQTESDFLIYNIDSKTVSKVKTNAKKIPISLHKYVPEGAFMENNNIKINLNNKNMTIQELALQGKHNAFNCMAAAVAARVFEVKDSIIRQSMIDFQNVEHRLEYVLTVHGIDFINDSKATNINACWYALESMHKDVIWIAGGVDKGNDYSQIQDLVEEKVKSIVCLGESNTNIISAFSKKVDSIVNALDMKDAIKQAYNIANKGEVVLLSPACASFDLFKNYEDRGLQFKQEVRNL